MAPFPLNRNEILSRCVFEQSGIDGRIMLLFPLSDNFSIALGIGDSKEEARLQAWTQWRKWFPKLSSELVQLWSSTLPASPPSER